MVVKSGDQRKKLISSEHLSIASGDIIELIPGHYFFKYVTLPQKRPSSHESTKEDLNPKKLRQQVCNFFISKCHLALSVAFLIYSNS